MVKYFLPILSICLLGFAVYYVLNRTAAPAEAKLLIQPAVAAFENTVAGAGMVEPSSEDIAMGSPVPGLVMEVYVQKGDHVTQGTPLFRLDDRQLQAELTVRKAALQSAQAQLAELVQQPRPERVPVSRAQVVEAEARLSEQKDLLVRYEKMFKQNAIAEQDVISRRQSHQAATAQLDRAKAELELLLAGAWEYEKDIAQAAVAQAEANIKATEIELDRLVIRALSDGRVLQVNVRPGEFVGAPSADPLMILGSVEKLHVRVDIDEHDIPRFTPGRPAKATLRGNTQDEIPLEFVRVEPYVVPKRSLTGSGVERVDTRVLQVIYSLEPTETRPVYVGQQLEVYIQAGKQPVEETAKASAKPKAK